MRKEVKFFVANAFMTVVILLAIFVGLVVNEEHKRSVLKDKVKPQLLALEIASGPDETAAALKRLELAVTAHDGTMEMIGYSAYVQQKTIELAGY